MWCCAPDCLGVDQWFTHGSARTWWSMSRTAFCHMSVFASIDLYKLTYIYIYNIRQVLHINSRVYTLSSMLRQVRISQKLLQVKPKFQKFGALCFMRSPACWKNRTSIGSMHIIFGPWPWMQYSASLSPVRAPPLYSLLLAVASVGPLLKSHGRRYHVSEVHEECLCRSLGWTLTVRWPWWGFAEENPPKKQGSRCQNWTDPPPRRNQGLEHIGTSVKEIVSSCSLISHSTFKITW